jgi:CBS domain-containing protein
MREISFTPEMVPDGGGPLFEGTDGQPSGELMTQAVATVPPWISMAAARKVAALKSAELLLVAEEDRLLGFVIVSELGDAPDEDKVSARLRGADALRGWRALSVTPATPAARARQIMLKNRLACLPVLAGSFVVGAITRDAIERAAARARSENAQRRAGLAA